MERHFEKQLDELKNGLASMSHEVERSIQAAQRCLLERDAVLAEGTFSSEKIIDAAEVRMEEMILDFIALHQPVAVDLRFVLSLQDAVVDLERIGDHATNIAQSAITLVSLRNAPELLHIPKMLELANRMLTDSVKSFLLRDASLARETIALDDRMDEMNRDVARQVIQLVKEDRQLVETGLELIRISRNLERVGDLSANIAEDALFLIEGRSVRHQEKEQAN